jgi:hypothetical protein
LGHSILEDVNAMNRLTIALLTAFALFALGGCVADAPSNTATVAPDEAPTAVAVEEQAKSNAPAADAIMKQLTFAGNGDTFLEAIGGIIAEKGPPLDHRYLGANADEESRLQGEVLVYTEQVITLVQLAESGGMQAVQIVKERADDSMNMLLGDENELLEALKTDQQADPPNAAINFVRARRGDDGRWSFSVTIEHPDTGWEDYADGWHVESADGRIFGTRILLHPHETEQPFTRSLSGVEIPDNVAEVYVRSHDLISGYSYDTIAIPIGQAGSGTGYEVER